MANNNPVIVVHGIQGSWLKDEYPVDYQDSVLWTGILRKKFESLHLHPVDADVDADAGRLINPHQAVPLVYESLVEEIREELEDRHPYVYMFTYDWRKDNRLAAARLGQFVERVLHMAGVHERSKTPPAPTPKKVTLIGHSMGGLVIKWYVTKILGKEKAPGRIDKIITIATPWRGSLKAVEALLPGARNLFGVENKKSMRHASRTLPGIYQLLPAWRQAIVEMRSGKPMNVFEPQTWQKNLLADLRQRFGDKFFGKMLADAKKFTAAIRQPWPQKLRSRIYLAYGHETETWWQVPVDTKKDNFFHFDDVRTGPGSAGVSGGDGTVHVVSSIRSDVPVRNLKADLRETFKDSLAGHHANMPNHSNVQDWVLGLLDVNEHAGAAFESPL